MSILSSRSKKRATQRTKHERMYDFLSGQQTAVLATAARDGTPHAAVIYYAVDPLLKVVFITKKQTKKGRNLRLNNRAALTVYDEPTQTTIDLYGTVTEIKDPAEASQAFRNGLRASLHTAGNAIPPISKLSAGDYIAYRLAPSEVRMAVFNRRSSEYSNNLLEVIKFDR